MADSVLVFNQKVSAPDSVENFYQAPSTGGGVKIKAFTASNDTTSSATYKAYIYSSVGTVVSAVIPQTIVVRDRADYGASAVGQVIPVGGSLRVESSVADGLNFYVSGQEL